MKNTIKEFSQKGDIPDIISVRFIKTQPMYRSNKKGNKIVPKLLICGNWLEKVGFISNEYVRISVTKNKLIIERDTCDEIKPHTVSNINKNNCK